jgi:hypothetical protein
MPIRKSDRQTDPGAVDDDAVERVKERRRAQQDQLNDIDIKNDILEGGDEPESIRQIFED